jgi:transmembrane sensor
MKRRVFYKRLVRRYLENQASGRELEVFFHLLATGKLDGVLHAAMKTEAKTLLGDEKVDTKVRGLPLRRWPLAAAAVAGLILLAGILWWHGEDRPEGKKIAASYYKNEVLPGGNHATLTLVNGTRIVLDSVGRGNIGTQGSARVVKVSLGALSYQATDGPAAAVSYNTISTPSGGQYQVSLADGTKVWLNALSSLKFPTSFNSADRTVELTGEAYFEVAADKSKPFHVKANGMEVLVLGTHFNVNAYADEGAFKTTLLAGSVKLIKGNAVMMLAPGDQGLSEGADGLSLVRDADISEAVAWKNGYFSFDDASVQTVMRQLARWYGIRVEYQGTPTRALFWGKMGRDLTLTQVLAGLSKSKVHFQLEGTTLTVLP